MTTVTKKLIEHVTMVGDRRQKRKMIEKCCGDGYRISRCGPVLKPTFKIDPRLYEVVGEREVQVITELIPV